MKMIIIPAIDQVLSLPDFGPCCVDMHPLLTLTALMWGRDFYYPHFRDEEAQPYSGQSAWPRSLGQLDRVKFEGSLRWRTTHSPSIKSLLWSFKGSRLFWPRYRNTHEVLRPGEVMDFVPLISIVVQSCVSVSDHGPWSHLHKFESQFHRR
jgi:hypothetical protein